LRVRLALGAVLLIAAVNFGLALLPGRMANLLPGAVFAVLSFFIQRKSLAALLMAAGIHGVISGWLALTHQVTWTFAIGFRAFILLLILQAIGPVQLVRGQGRNLSKNEIPLDD
jgi:hypothetical protein